VVVHQWRQRHQVTLAWVRQRNVYDQQQRQCVNVDARESRHEQQRRDGDGGELPVTAAGPVTIPA
jgi:hypothetical protein